MVSNTLCITSYNHLITTNAVNDKPRLMGTGRRLGCFTLNYEVIYKVVSSPSSFSTFFIRFRHSGRTDTITTLKLDLAFSTYLVSRSFFFVCPKNIGPQSCDRFRTDDLQSNPSC